LAEAFAEAFRSNEPMGISPASEVHVAVSYVAVDRAVRVVGS
jgi:hypothetical protein